MQMLSRRLASGEATQAPAFWSRAEVSQSAASAAGVVPPITKWKKRGPADRVAVSRPSRARSLIAGSAPAPSSGSAPPSCVTACLAAVRLHGVAIQCGEERASLRGGEVQRLLELRAPFPRIRHRPAC